MPPLKALNPESTPELKEFWELAVSRRSQVTILDRLLAHSPVMGTHWHQMAFGIRHQIEIPAHLREALILRTVTLESAPFAQSAHVAIGKNVGLTDEDIEVLCLRQTTGASADVAFHGELASAIASPQPDGSIIEDAVSRYGEKYALEAMLTVGFYRMVATVTKSLALERWGG